MEVKKSKHEPYFLKSKVYLYLRLLMLPIPKINRSLPKKGKILDLGCGNGGLSIILAKFSPGRFLIGWDIDSLRVRDAIKQSFGNKQVLFKVMDVITSRIPKINGAIASDFLHHLSKNEQEVVIKKIYSSLEKNGVFVIKETDQDDFIRHGFSKFWDNLFYPGDRTHYRGEKEWTDFLRYVGFSVSSKKCVFWFPGSTKLFICKKK